jgi:hypothetical protein
MEEMGSETEFTYVLNEENIEIQNSVEELETPDDVSIYEYDDVSTYEHDDVSTYEYDHYESLEETEDTSDTQELKRKRTKKRTKKKKYLPDVESIDEEVDDKAESDTSNSAMYYIYLILLFIVLVIVGGVIYIRIYGIYNTSDDEKENDDINIGLQEEKNRMQLETENYFTEENIAEIVTEVLNGKQDCHTALKDKTRLVLTQTFTLLLTHQSDEEFVTKFEAQRDDFVQELSKKISFKYKSMCEKMVEKFKQKKKDDDFEKVKDKNEKRDKKNKFTHCSC